MVVDAFARVFVGKDTGNVDFGKLRRLMDEVSMTMDLTGEHRVNFIFSSLASVPLRQLASRLGRGFQVSLHIYSLN